MKLTLEQMECIFNKYPSADVDLKYFEKISMPGQNFLPMDIILPAHLKKLRQNGKEIIDVCYNPVMYDFLNSEFPSDFRRPYGKMRFMEMDRYLETLESINTQSHRKRYVHIVGDIYGLDTKEGKRIVILSHNEKLNYRKWNDLKRLINTKQDFLYRTSECGIIVFVNLSHAQGADSSFVQRFKKNTDIISVLVSKKDCSDDIAPDFVPTEDVVSVTDPAALLHEYTDTDARLVIIGDELDDAYKNALLDLRRYDKFVRMIVVPALDYSNLDHFIQQVKLVYNSNRWE